MKIPPVYLIPGTRPDWTGGSVARRATAMLLKCVPAQAVGLLLCMSAILSAATVYLPAPGAMTTYSITGATTTTPIVISVTGSAPPNGTPLWIYGVGGQSCANGFWITAGAS